MPQLIAFLIAVSTLVPTAPPPATPVMEGMSKYYSAGVFNTVLATRRSQGYDVHYNGGYLAAHYDCTRIGQYMYLQLQYPSGRWGPVTRFLVIDCAQPRHRASQKARKLYAEVPYFVAKQYGFLGRDCKRGEHGCSLVRIIRFARQ